MPPTAVVVIPARYASTRFPGKVLAAIAGRPMLVHVIERARRARFGQRVVVATDDDRILQVARSAGAEARMTSPDHPSGSDRIAEIAGALDAEIIVNLQADEPLVPSAAVDRCVELLAGDTTAGMATLAHPLHPEAAGDPNAVKVVCDEHGLALYFSRAPIPHAAGDAPAAFLRHIGIYAYRRDSLLRIAATPPTPLERTERLEQLRALELGIRIRVAVVDWQVQGVDTPGDLERVEDLLGRG